MQGERGRANAEGLVVTDNARSIVERFLHAQGFFIPDNMQNNPVGGGQNDNGLGLAGWQKSHVQNGIGDFEQFVVRGLKLL